MRGLEELERKWRDDAQRLARGNDAATDAVVGTLIACADDLAQLRESWGAEDGCINGAIYHHYDPVPTQCEWCYKRAAFLAANGVKS